MKIIYSPHYDGEIFLGDQPGCFDTLYAGNLSLLQQLGLRSGLCVNPVPDMEREVAYQTAMRKPLVGTRFEKSAQSDPIGVAAKLLLWRDNLIMAGWDGTCDDTLLTKLHTLAEIEKNFKCKGNADYWRTICQQYESKDDFPNPIKEIQIDCPWSEIPCLIQRTLNALENRGARLIMTVDESKQVELQADKIKVVQFTDLLDAYEWMARVEKMPENCAIINRDNVRLNHTFYTWNKPAVHASLTQSNPQLLQLFKLSLSVFSRPLNLNNLVSYLQLPSGPIPRSLRFKLLHILLKNGGFGEVKMRDEWDEAILTYEFKEYDKNGNPQPGDNSKVRAAKMYYLLPIRQDFSKGLNKIDLNAYVDRMQEWVNGILQFDKKKKEAAASLPATTDERAIMKPLSDERIQQLHELSAMFSAFRQALAAMDNTLTYSDIEKMVLRIYRPMSYTLQQAEQNSLNVINDIRSMAAPAGTLIWLDCQSEDIERDAYDFLSTPERQYLADNNVQIPDFAHHLKICRQERNRLLNSVKGHLILVQSLYDGVKRLGEHSLVAEVKHLCGEDFKYVDASTLFRITSPKPEEKDIDTFEPQMYYDLESNNKRISAFKGREESNSSIEKLIQRPFNYVMDYVADLPAPDEEQLKSPYITTGLVAHHFFQHIIEAGNNYTAMRNLTDSSFDQYLDAAIQATGLIMLLEENATQLHNFRWQLKQSMLTLIDIMEHLSLTHEGCEIAFPETGKTLSLSTIGDFGARIDFLLTNSNGDYVIFDFKWNYSKMYPEKLEEDASIQLELYRQAVLATYPGKNVVGIGYYMMPKQQLFTPDFNDWDNKICKVVPANPQQVFKQIQNSYNFRKEELMKGHIEEAELMDVAGIDYYTKTIGNQYYIPLEYSDKKKKDKKASEYVFRPSKKKSFDNDKKEPYEIPTSHPILKGRLK
ncbi:MAG: PD-(D/E)XK nuclease family protein [Bacteroidales bacterium]|nr:PD-(D/E)XK nuclease family protein [Bacteroidales bacterium]